MHHYKKGEYRDQFVIAYITSFDNYNEVVLWSLKFCNMLQKGLILLYICDSKYNSISPDEAKMQLEKINSNIKLRYIHSYAALSGKTKDIIHNLGDILNGVMIVTHIHQITNKKDPISIPNIINNFYSSRLAYFVFKDYKEDNNFKNSVVSINAMKECKEKILWASYFGRFADSITHIYYHRYRDEYLQKQLNLNIGFLRRMFRKFGIETINAHSLDRHTKLDVQTMYYAQNNDCDICIFQTTKNKSYIEFFSGLPEKKVLQMMQSIPVLFLNQRDDLFVMCE